MKEKVLTHLIINYVLNWIGYLQLDPMFSIDSNYILQIICSVNQSFQTCLNIKNADNDNPFKQSTLQNFSFRNFIF